MSVASLRFAHKHGNVERKESVNKEGTQTQGRRDLDDDIFRKEAGNKDGCTKESPISH